MSSSDLTKLLISQPGEWHEFYVQDPQRRTRSGERYARNRANVYRMYIKRKGYPVEIRSIKDKHGLIHCWGRWNEGGESSQPPTGR